MLWFRNYVWVGLIYNFGYSKIEILIISELTKQGLSTLKPVYILLYCIKLHYIICHQSFCIILVSEISPYEPKYHLLPPDIEEDSRLHYIERN